MLRVFAFAAVIGVACGFVTPHVVRSAISAEVWLHGHVSKAPANETRTCGLLRVVMCHRHHVIMSHMFGGVRQCQCCTLASFLV